MNRLGLDPYTIDLKFLGDAYMEFELLKRSIEQTSLLQNIHYDSQEVAEQINKMREATTKELADRLGLEVGKELTQEQIYNLEEDIIWYVEQSIELPSGEIYKALVPQIYYCKSSLQKMEQQRIANTTYTLIAGDSVYLQSKHSEQLATATINNSGTIQANDILKIDGFDTINNITSSIRNEDINSLSKEQYNNQATLSAGNTLIINSGENGVLNNLSGLITLNNTNNNTNNGGLYDNLLYINTGTLNNTTLSQQEEFKHEGKGNKHEIKSTYIGDTATISSNNNNSNIIINTENDINITGADILANGNNSNIELSTNNGNINISTVEDYEYEYMYAHRDGSTFKKDKTMKSETETLTNIASNIKANNGNLTIRANQNPEIRELLNKINNNQLTPEELSNINMDELLKSINTGNINIVGSNIHGDNGANLIADNNINLLTSVDKSSTYSFYSEDNNLRGGKSDEVRDTKTTNNSTNISSTQGNINIIAGKDINSVASNINTKEYIEENGGNINLLAGYTINNTTGQLARNTLATGNVNLLSTQDQSTHFEDHQKWGGVLDMVSNFDMNLDRNGLTISTSYEKTLDEKNTTTNTARVNNIESAGNLNINATENILSVGSQIYANKDINLTAGYTDAQGNKHNGDIILKSADNNQTTDTKHEETKVTQGIKIGNAYMDAYNAGDAVTKAGEAVKKAKDELDRIKKLRDEGKASDSAVKDAEANVAMASVNLANATIAFASSVAGAASAASTSFGTGFYASAFVNAETKSSTSNEQSTWQTQGNIQSGFGDINFNTTNNMLQEGTNVYASNSNGTGTISYDIGNDLNIIASKDTYSYTSEEKTKSAGGSVGNNAVQLNYGQSESNSRIFSTTYNNVDIIANNINIKTGNNTDIKGANVLAQAIIPNHSPLEGESNEQGLNRSSFGGGSNIGGNINMDIGNNLNIESLQDSYYAKSKSSSFGISAGGGKTDKGGKKGNGGFNFGKTNSTTDSQWVNEQTSIIADNNINIRTKNNTNLTGSVVASNSDNLSLNTGSLTYSDLNDFYREETKGYNFGTSVGGNRTDQKETNLHPQGSTTIGLTHTGQEREQITRATIGNGSVVIVNKEINEENNNQNLITGLNRNVDNSQEITKDIITGALNGSMTIDNRLFTSDGRSSIANDFKNLPDNAIIATEGALNMPIAGPIWWSKYIDRNNDNINDKTGEKEERGQPTFETGDKNPYDPSVGIGTDSCRKGTICGPLFSDQGWLKYLDEDVPGFSDFSAFHDNHMSKVENVIGETASIPVKVISIPVYLGVYYYGAVGTQLENGINYLKNRTYNSKSVVIKK